MTSMSFTFLRFLNCIFYTFLRFLDARFYTFLRFFLGGMYENGQSGGI